MPVTKLSYEQRGARLRFVRCIHPAPPFFKKDTREKGRCSINNPNNFTPNAPAQKTTTNGLTLWVVEAHNGQRGELLTLYAHDEEEARSIAAPWLKLRPNLHQVEFTAYPHGFTIYHATLPGTIPERL